MRRRVVVTGLGMVTPNGIEVAENWRKALDGVSGIRKLRCPGAGASEVQAVGGVTRGDMKTIEAEFPEEAEREGETKTLFALWAAKRALEDAGLAEGGGDRGRWGVSLASGIGINRPEDIARWADGDGGFDYVRFARELEMLHRESMLRHPTHRTAALIARKWGLGGINRTTTTACAASAQAIGLAFREVRRGRADLVLAGGADSMINPVGLTFFVLLRAASTYRGEPAGACRPYDRRRTGLVMGEGAGVVVLEELGHALGRGARIYAELRGYASSLDAYQLTAPPPDGRGAVSSMRAALKDAGLGPEDIDYINGHGTGTKLNDPSETAAVKSVFGGHAGNIVLNSSKSIIGHLLCAAGGPELIFTVLSVRDDVVHPTLNLTHPDPKCDLDYVPLRKRHKTVRAAMTNSFGFGGQDATIVVAKYKGGDDR